MWHGFANSDLRAHKGAHDKPTSPAFQATSPMRGGLTTNDGATGPKLNERNEKRS